MSLKKLLGFFSVVFVPLFIVSLFIIMSGGIDDQKQCEDSKTNNVTITDQGMEENAKQLVATLKPKYQASPQGLAGMLGNFQQESSVSPKSIERPNDPLSGHGLAQWTADRTTKLMDFAKSKKKEWNDLGLQTEFLMDELDHSYPKSINALKETDVHQATDDWEHSYEGAGTANMSKRYAFADAWFSKLNSSDPITKSTTKGATDTQIQDSQVGCNTSKNQTDGDILKKAKSYLGSFHYPNPDTHSVAMLGGKGASDPDKKNGITDCSGFVWLVLQNAGYKVPDNMGWFTGTMSADAKKDHQWLQAEDEKDAKAGDIVIVNVGSGINGSGHTAILEENWHGDNTKIIQMGGSHDVINEDTFKSSFLSLLNGGDICLAKPIRK